MTTRPGTAFSRVTTTGSGPLLNEDASTTINDLTQARDLLERMVQERDEKITTLQSTTAIHKEHIGKLQEKLDTTYTREKQQSTRHMMQVNVLVRERDIAKTKNEVLEKELKLARENPLSNGFELLSGGSGGGKETPKKAALNLNSPFATPTKSSSSSSSTGTGTGRPISPENIPNSPQQTLLLQSQLYHAMNSISSLRLQTSVMKENYDEIVADLQEELLDARDKMAKNEVDLMSKLSVLEREKKVMERIFEEKMKKKDEKLNRLEMKLKASNLSSFDDDEFGGVVVKEEDKDPTTTGTGTSNDKDSANDQAKGGGKSSDPAKNQNGHRKVEDMLEELEALAMK